MAQPFYYEYTPEPGDSLVSVIYRLYGWSPPSQRYHELRGLIMQMNPHVKNPDRLDTDLALRVPDQRHAASSLGQPLLERLPVERGDASPVLGDGLGRAQRAAHQHWQRGTRRRLEPAQWRQS